MRILLLQSSAYIPSLGGANKANRLLLEQLAAQGHECNALGTASGGDGAATFRHARHAGVEVEAVLDPALLRARAAARLRELAPDRVLVSSEDPGQVLLAEAVLASPHVVYLAHTTLHLPFGPDGFLESPGRTALLHRAAGIVAVSGYVQGYIRRWAGLGSTLLRFPVYGDGPFPELGDFDRGFVTLINPCAVKGISIFLELARRLPEVAFAAVPTWGTTAEDREALAALPNVRILPPTAAIDEIFRETRVLLVPSLWGEAFGQVAVEAMLRGIPVLASDAGGLPEAKLGVDDVLPVRPIRRYEERFDERKIPVAVVPEQDLGPWEEALRRVLGDRELYARLSRESRRAAHDFVAGLGIASFQDYLEGLPARAEAGRRRLKILLVQPLTYLFSPGGAHKANRLLLEGLAARGHACRVVAPGDVGSAEQSVFDHRGVEVHAVAGGLELCAEAARQIHTFDPDWTIVSEDPSGEVLQQVLAVSPSRVVYLAHSPATLPFGPAAFVRDEAKTDLLRRTAGILTVSRAMQDYFRRWAGLDSTVVYSPAYGSGPFPALARPDRGFIAMINPSGIKGVSIFAGLARRMPEVAFAAVPTWSTTDGDRALLAGLPNVTLLPATDDVDELFAPIRVLLVPSLWGEAFGQVVVEALLRGVPVITSDQGGLPEAGLGVTRIVPVRPIERYEDRLDDRRMPVPVVPEQDLDPWAAELSSLLAGRAAYERLSAASREAAARFVAGLGIEPYERFLADLAPAPAGAPAAGPPPAAGVRQKLAGLSPEKLELLARRLKKKEGGAPEIPRLPRRGTAADDRFILSFAQRRLWFLDRFEPGRLTYNERFAVYLSGPLAVRSLALALGRIVQRHEVLRTTYAEGGEEPVQVVHPPPPDDRPDGGFPLPVADLGALPDGAQRAAAARLATAESGRPFDLREGPVMRALLLGLGAEERLLVITAHHIAVDNWSATVLFSELAALYGALLTGSAPALPELPVQYADFAAWQRGWLTGATLDEQIGFWRGQLAGAPGLTVLPTDRPRPALQGFRGTRRTARLPPRLAEALRALARQRDATLYMLLLAACQALLHRLTDQDDLVVGTPVAGRTRRQIEPLIGCFLNLLPMRARVAPGLPFAELLGEARRTALAAFAHQDLPFERLVEALAPERSLSHSPIFQVLFNFLNVPPRTAELPGGARLADAPVETGTIRFDLELYLEEKEQGLAIDIDASTDLFDDSTIARLLGQLEVLLAGVAGRPDDAVAELPLLGPTERHQLLREWNDAADGGASELPGPGVHQLVAAQARRTPAAPAAAFQGSEVTYADLAGRARRLAQRLRALGSGPETRIGIALERSLDLLVALLGVLESGAAYVPLDPSYPRERLALVLEDAAPRVLITEERLRAELPPTTATVLSIDGELPPDGSDTPAPFHDLQVAYTLYTSGSTGRPKGVEIPHRALVNFLGAMRRNPGFALGERLLAVTSLAFDIAALEIFLPLTTGGCVCLASREEAADGLRLAARLRASGAGVLQGTPATWRMLLDAGWGGDLRLRAFCGGEALPESLAAELRERTAGVWNLYGPTEATVWSSVERLAAGPVSIGRPIANTELRVVDAQGGLLPAGCPGELLLGGAGLARGYLGRPDLTAERFVPDGAGAALGARLYRTGDLARLLPDGRLEHLGRLDNQVKVRGFRIELGEIEQALAAHPGVGQTVVVARAEQGAAHLVAWLVPAAGADPPPAPADLREHLRRTLPDYMIPSAFVALPELPLTPNRKVDRGALARREIGRPAARPGAAPLAPRGALEEALAAIWRQVLNVEQIGVDESFFDVGGHSLKLVQVQAGIRSALGIEVPVVDLFRHPTIAALAAHLGGDPAAPAPATTATTAQGPQGTDLAIIGMAARLPGAPDLDRFWSRLRDGVECITRLTDGELRAAGVDPAQPGRVPAEPLIEGIELFDASFFGFSPREAELLDPQQRLFLELAWSCMESAGYDPGRYPGRVGIFAGESFSTYLLNLLSQPELRESLDPLSFASSIDKDYLATRVAYELGLRGPGLSVQTACSTSLVAVHLARQSLLLGECEMALAGGITLRVPQGSGYRYHEGGIASPDGHCRTFDAAARGTVFGSGAGIVLLKRLADARRDGDTIRAVLKGSAINNDGALKVGFTAPSVDGQAEVIRAAQEAAGVSPETVTYVEAHGTATPLGDPIEVAALTQAFRRGTRRIGFCAIGSVKSNLGHLDAAAGVTGLIKTVLALEHRQIPPTLHFQSPNPQIDFASSPFYVNARLADWPAEAGPRRAGVSSFGIGGTNAHAVLEEAPAAAPSGPARRHQLLLLSARTPAALEEATRNLADHLEAHPEASLPGVAWTLQVGRQAFEHRRALVATGVADAVATLRDPAGAGRVLTRRQEAGRRGAIFLFPGQGAQHPDMGRELYEEEPVFRAAIDASAERLLPHLGRDLRALLYPPAEEREAAARTLRETRFAQPALFAVELALARLWISWGVQPEAMIGHSLGEYVAACLAGVFSAEEALELVACRGALMQELPPGAMLSVELPAGELGPELAALPDLALAAVNAPSLSVASGPEAAVEALAARLAGRGVETRRLHTSHAFHSAMMDPVLAAFAARVARAAPRPPAIPFVSNLTGTWITAAQATDPGYWARHLRETVRFADGLAALLAGSRAVLLEVGPGRALVDLARWQTDPAGLPAPVSSLPRAADTEPSAAAALLGALGRLWLAGVEVDWPGFAAGERRRRIPLPTYPFERQRFWVELASAGGSAPRRPAAEPATREAPPLPGHARPGIDTPYKEPESDAERRLAAIWGSLLGIDRVGIHDDFFELGGHSLLATRLIARVREAFGREIPLESVFAAPTVARFAALLAAPAEPRESQAPPIPPIPPIIPVPRTGPLPLSFAQQRLWFLDQLSPGSNAYNMAAPLRLTGRLDRAALARALSEIVRRHESLRTTFAAADGEPFQRVAPAAAQALPLVDLAALPPGAREAELHRAVLGAAALPFDLERGPLLRSILVETAAGEHALLFTIHHIVSDGWSMGVLTSELAALYAAFSAGRPAPLPELPLQYADFAAWQRGWLQGEALARELAFWRTVMAGAPHALELPTDRPRPAVQTFGGAIQTLGFSRQTSAAVRACGQARGATPFMVLLAAFTALLFRQTGQTDIVTGTPVANRSRTELEGLIGFFANTLLTRTDLSGDPPFADLLQRVQSGALAAFRHQDMPFERLVEELRPQRDTSRQPLFQVMFAFQNVPVSGIELPGLALRPIELGEPAEHFDLTLFLHEADGVFSPALRYNTGLFDGATAVRLLARFRLLVEAAVADPRRQLSSLPLLSAAERHGLLYGWNDAGAAASGDRLVHELFREQARRRPAATALAGAGERLTYRDLDERSDRLARGLSTLGVGPETLVGICLPRAPEVVVAILAVLKAGGAYLPLDPAYPKERLAFMLRQGEARVLLTRRALLGDLPEHGARTVCLDADPLPEGPAEPQSISSAQAAYVIFTSGSTGRPKGAILSHANLCSYVSALGDRLGIGEDDVYLHTASFSFSSSVRQMMLPLCRGAALVLAGPEEIGDPLRLCELIRRCRATVADLVPSYWRSCLHALAELDAEERRELLDNDLRLLVSASERLLSDVPDSWRRKLGHPARLLNMLGQTETTGIVSTYPIPAGAPERIHTVPIGRPLPGAALYLLDGALEPVPLSVPGEVYIGGTGVGRGYLGQPDLTAERFVPDPWSGAPGARLYRTGDLARALADGNLGFIGRRDHQIKIRGFRIEAGEVEATLNRHPAVREAAVLARDADGTAGERLLVAWFVPVGEPAPAAADLRAFLQRLLPEYMIPSHFVRLASLPLTPTGKVDRGALPDVDPARLREVPGRVPPRNEKERALAEIWAHVLRTEDIGVTDNFFDLGGHSLLATQVTSRIRKSFAREVPVRLLFENPTIAALAAALADVAPDPGKLRTVRKVARASAARPRSTHRLSDAEVDDLLRETLRKKTKT
jgi:amino acid adenylation domain-containing protein